MFRYLASLLLVTALTMALLTGCAGGGTVPATPPTTPTAPTTTLSPTPVAFKWPDRLSIITSTGTGNAQWLSYTALMSKDTGMDIRLVQESAPAVRFKSVQNGQYFATSGSNGDFQNIIEALETYATADGGPFQMRALWSNGMAWSGFLATNTSGIKVPADIKPGTKMGDTVNSPNVKNKQLAALLAWANVPMDKITWVPFSDYNATVGGLAGKIDVAFAFPTSPSVLQLGNTVHYIELDPVKDPAGAERYLSVDPVTTFSKVLEGPDWLVGAMSKGSATASIVSDKADTDLVYNFVKWLDKNYASYKDAHPQNKYMTRSIFMEFINTTFIPVHPGTIKYLKELNLWTAANDKRQQANIDFLNRWITAYQDAMKQAAAKGVSVDPSNKDWLAFWAKYKTENRLPVCKAFLGL